MKVFIAKSLSEQFPIFYDSLVQALWEYSIDVEELPTQNLWARDYMPVRTNGQLTKFNYIVGESMIFPQLEVDPKCWSWLEPRQSNLSIDGGNVEQNDTTVLMTDIVFQHNNFSGIMKNLLIQSLEKRFKKKIIFLPVEPDDDLGHIDGIAKFIDSKKVFINDYSVMNNSMYNSYQELIEKTLMDNGLEPVILPFAYHKCPHLSHNAFYSKYPFADDQNEGTGYYINMLELEKILLLPSFGFEEDDKCKEVVEQYYPDKKIIQIDCSDVSQLGGLIHCVTWEM